MILKFNIEKSHKLTQKQHVFAFYPNINNLINTNRNGKQKANEEKKVKEKSKRKKINMF